MVIDTPPALNFYSMSALIAAESVLIPFDCDAFSAQAVDQVLATITEVRADHAPSLALEGVIINHFQPQTKQALQWIQELEKKGIPLLQPYLSQAIAMKESHAVGKPLVYSHPKHKLTQQFIELANSLIQTKKRKNSSQRKPQRNELPHDSF